MQLSVPPSFSTVPVSQSDKTLAGQVLTIQHLVPARPPPLPVSGRHLRLKVSISSKRVWPLSPASPEKGHRALAFLLGVVQEMLTLCPSCPGALTWLCWRWYGERDRVQVWQVAALRGWCNGHLLMHNCPTVTKSWVPQSCQLGKQDSGQLLQSHTGLGQLSSPQVSTVTHQGGSQEGSLE